MAASTPPSAHADSSVRPALISDAAAIGTIHAHTMQESIEAGLDAPLGNSAHLIDAHAITKQWHHSIENPPSARHRVLTALEGHTVVGFAAFEPAENLHAPAATHTHIDAQIVALEVAENHRHRGHEDRLINAIGDILMRTRARGVQIWVTVGDDFHIRLVEGAGFAPAGVMRKIRVGENTIIQHLWFSTLEDEN